MEEILKRANIEAARNLTRGERVSYEEAKKLIKNPETFATRLESSEKELQAGVTLRQETIELDGEHFTNVYDLQCDTSQGITANIITGNSLFYQHRLFHPQNRYAVAHGLPLASINGAFFFLQDTPLEKVPSEIMYNLNIRDGQILGLPAVNRCALVVDNEGKLEAVNLQATGTMTIGTTSIQWQGGEPIAHAYQTMPEDEHIILLFNSACCTIEYDNSQDKTSLRALRKDLNYTPKRKNVVDVVVTLDKDSGLLEVNKLNSGGGTDFFEGNFILQMHHQDTSTISVGDIVTPQSIGNMDITQIQAAITVGPEVSDFLTQENNNINNDKSLGSFPPFAPDKRYARSVIYQDIDEKLHLTVFDAVPQSEHMKGVTPKEVADHIPTDAKWAVFLDGGQSSRITYNDPEAKNGIAAKGNQQYLRLHELHKAGQGKTTVSGEDQYLWSGSGRPVPAAITLHQHKKNK